MIYNFPDHIKGDTFAGVQFEVLVNNAPLDLTGASIRMYLKKTMIRGEQHIYSTANNRLTLTNPSQGIFTFNQQTIDIESGDYVYDIEITMPNNNVHTYIRGNWRILKDITFT